MNTQKDRDGNRYEITASRLHESNYCCTKMMLPASTAHIQCACTKLCKYGIPTCTYVYFLFLINNIFLVYN